MNDLYQFRFLLFETTKDKAFRFSKFFDPNICFEINQTSQPFKTPFSLIFLFPPHSFVLFFSWQQSNFINFSFCFQRLMIPSTLFLNSFFFLEWGEENQNPMQDTRMSAVMLKYNIIQIIGSSCHTRVMKLTDIFTYIIQKERTSLFKRAIKKNWRGFFFPAWKSLFFRLMHLIFSLTCPF